MKNRRIFFLLLALCVLPFVATAQGKQGARNNINMIRQRSAYEEGYLERWMNLGKSRSSVRYKKEMLTRIPVNDTTALLYSEDHSFLYLGGSVEANGYRSAYPSGYGLACYAITAGNAGSIGAAGTVGTASAKQFEYCFCPWKRGSRHGEGLLVSPDGTVVKATWRWDKLKSVSEEPPTEEELAELDRRIARLQATVELLGR